MHAALWVAQLILAGVFGFTGRLKAFTPMPELVSILPWAAEGGEPVVRFIGYAELAGAVGVIVPAATRIWPKLTPLAALALMVVMILATIHHVARNETNAVPLTAGLGLLALFVAWGRWKKVPLKARNV